MMMRKIQRPILSQVTNIRLISTVQSARSQSFETEVLAQEETAHEMHTIRILRNAVEFRHRTSYDAKACAHLLLAILNAVFPAITESRRRAP
jgi:hypothetical protein